MRASKDKSRKISLRLFNFKINQNKQDENFKIIMEEFRKFNERIDNVIKIIAGITRKVENLNKAFKIYVENNGVDEKVKKIVKELLETD